MVNKGKVEKRKVSTARKSAPKAAVDHAANPQRPDTHTPPGSSRNLRPSSPARGTDPPPSQLAGDAQSTPRYMLAPLFYDPHYQGRLVLDQPYSTSMHGHVSDFWVHPSIKDAVPYARRSILLDPYKNVPSPHNILTSQYPDLPFDDVSLPPTIDSASHPRETSSMSLFCVGEEQSARFEAKIPDSDTNSDWDNNGGRDIRCHENRGDTRVPRQADSEANGLYVEDCHTPTWGFFEKFWPGNARHSDNRDASSDVSSDASSDIDVSGTEQSWSHVHPRPNVVIETSLNTKILCSPCTTLCTGIMTPWNIENGWTLTRPPRKEHHDRFNPILIAEHHKRSTLGDLRASATAGCALCAFVIQHCERTKTWLPGTDNMEKYSIHSYPTKNKKRMENCEFTVALASSGVQFEFCRQLGNDSDYEALEDQELFSEISEDLHDMCGNMSRKYVENFAGHWWPKLKNLANPCRSSAEAIARVQRLLTKCIDKHVGCYRRNSPLPKRVLDVSGSKIYLHVANGQEIDTRYLALSYAWGSSRFLTTVKANLKSHCEVGISFQSLPSTFKDAVFVTRALKYRHLWIDALCIIQDDDADWQEQYPRMTELYRDAVLTISATSSRGVDSGFLRRPTANEATLKVGSYHHSKGPGFGDLLIRTRNDVERFGQNAINAAHLNTRGWTFQERLMSTAVVHYTDEEIVWECNDAPRNETKGFEFSQDSISQRIKTALTGSIDRQCLFPLDLVPYPRTIRCPSNRVDISWAEIYDAWMLWVIRYTKRNLTFPKDRLPAIAGLAKVFSLRFGLTYKAGLWRESLPAGLLWFRVPTLDESESVKSERSLCAPSWSWASLSGAVGFRGWQATCSVRLPYTQRPFLGDLVVHHVEMSDALSRPFAERYSDTLDVEGLLQVMVIDLEVLALRGPSVFGELGSGAAVVEGLIEGIDMQILWDEEQRPANEPEHNELRLQPHLDRNKIQCYCLRVCSYWLLTSSERLGNMVDQRTLGGILEDAIAGVHHGSSAYDSNVPAGPGNNLICLLLASVDDQRNVFKRIGYAETVIEGRKRQSEGAFEEVMECDFFTAAEWKRLTIV